MSQKPFTRVSSRQTNCSMEYPESREVSSPFYCVPAKRRCNSAKHKKVLAHGKQIKTHLLCEHIGSKPIWGVGTSVKEPDYLLLHEQRANRQRMIDAKIDRLCLPKDQKISPRCSLKKNVKIIPLKHRKILSGGQQLKTHLVCEHIKRSPYIPSQERRLNMQENFSSSNYENSFDHGSASSGDIVISSKPVMKQSNLISHNERLERERRIFATLNSPDDVPIVDVRVQTIASLSHQQASYQADSSLPCAERSNSRFSRKRIRFEDEEPCLEDTSDFPPNACSEDNVDTRGSSDRQSCTLCGKKFGSLELRQNSDAGVSCQFCGYDFLNFEGSASCEFCSCCQDNGRCWAVQAYENSCSDGNIGMAQCTHCADYGKDYKNSNYSKPNSLSRNNLENSPPPSAVILKSKIQAKRVNQVHAPGKDFNHQCVHQYHQNSRLFLEPTSPDDRGYSTCCFCGLPAEEDRCLSCTSESDGLDSPEGHRPWRKVSFDVPRRGTVKKSTTAQQLLRNSHGVETRRRTASRSELNPSVLLENDGVYKSCMPCRKVSGSKTTSVQASHLSNVNTGSADRNRTSNLSSCSSASESVRNGRDPLFVVSVDPSLKRGRMYRGIGCSTGASKISNLNSAETSRDKRNLVRSSYNPPKRNPAHSMALEDHI